MLQFQNHLSDISALCNAHGVKHLYAFGSVLADKFNSESDVDLIVDFHPINLAEYADNYFDLKYSLENILNRKVDLLEEKAIQTQKKLLYGA